MPLSDTATAGSTAAEAATFSAAAAAAVETDARRKPAWRGYCGGGRLFGQFDPNGYYAKLHAAQQEHDLLAAEANTARAEAQRMARAQHSAAEQRKRFAQTKRTFGQSAKTLRRPSQSQVPAQLTPPEESIVRTMRACSNDSAAPSSSSGRYQGTVEELLKTHPPHRTGDGSGGGKKAEPRLWHGEDTVDDGTTDRMWADAAERTKDQWPFMQHFVTIPGTQFDLPVAPAPRPPSTARAASTVDLERSTAPCESVTARRLSLETAATHYASHAAAEEAATAATVSRRPSASQSTGAADAGSGRAGGAAPVPEMPGTPRSVRGVSTSATPAKSVGDSARATPTRLSSNLTGGNATPKATPKRSLPRRKSSVSHLSDAGARAAHPTMRSSLKSDGCDSQAARIDAADRMWRAERAAQSRANNVAATRPLLDENGEEIPPLPAVMQRHATDEDRDRHLLIMPSHDRKGEGGRNGTADGTVSSSVLLGSDLGLTQLFHGDRGQDSAVIAQKEHRADCARQALEVLRGEHDDTPSLMSERFEPTAHRPEEDRASEHGYKKAVAVDPKRAWGCLPTHVSPDEETPRQPVRMNAASSVSVSPVTQQSEQSSPPVEPARHARGPRHHDDGSVSAASTAVEEDTAVSPVSSDDGPTEVTEGHGKDAAGLALSSSAGIPNLAASPVERQYAPRPVRPPPKPARPVSARARLGGGGDALKVLQKEELIDRARPMSAQVGRPKVPAPPSAVGRTARGEPVRGPPQRPLATPISTEDAPCVAESLASCSRHSTSTVDARVGGDHGMNAGGSSANVRTFTRSTERGATSTSHPMPQQPQPQRHQQQRSRTASGTPTSTRERHRPPSGTRRPSAARKSPRPPSAAVPGTVPRPMQFDERSFTTAVSEGSTAASRGRFGAPAQWDGGSKQRPTSARRPPPPRSVLGVMREDVMTARTPKK